MAKKREKPKKIAQNAYGRLRDSILPGERTAWGDSRFEPAAQAPGLTAEKLHGILRNAEAGQTQELFAVYRDMILGDTHLLAEFSKRKLAVLKNPITFTARDLQDGEDVRAAELVAQAWERMRGKMDALTHLLDSALYPVSVVEKTYRPSKIEGLRFEWGSECGDAGLSPVPYHLLDFTLGRLRIEEVDEDTKAPLGRHQEPAAVRFVLHRGHLLTSIPDNWGGPMRAALFWWLFKAMDRGWWIRFLERFGAPFPVARYEDGREDTKQELKAAFAAATRLFGLVVTKGADVELIQSNTSQSGDAFEQFKSTADKELSKLILGQTMTAEAQAAGLGSAQAVVHNDVRNDYEAFDATKLAETLQDQVVDPFCQLNGLTGRVRVLVGAEDPTTAEETLRTLEVLPKAGFTVADDGVAMLSRRLNLPLMRVAAPVVPAVPGPGEETGDAALSADRGDRRDALLEDLAGGVAAGVGKDLAGLRPRPGQSPAEYQRGLRATLLQMAPHRSVRALEAALAVMCAEGA